MESQFRVLKDEIQHRVKGYNLNELVDIVTGPLEFHFHYTEQLKNKLLSVANGSSDGIYSSRFKGLHRKEHSEVDTVSVASKEKHLCSVLPSNKTVQQRKREGKEVEPYYVDMEIGFCTCPIGQDGSPCKHQFAVKKEFSLRSQNFLPMFCAIDCQQYAVIARGDSLDLSFYLGLQD